MSVVIKDALVARDDDVESRAQVVDLVLRRHDGHHGVEQSGRSDHLFDDLIAVLHLEGPRRRRDEDHLGHQLHELIEVERSVVQRARQSKAVLDQRLLARTVAGVLTADLGHRDVGLVDHDEVVLGEVVEQRVGTLAGLAAVEVRAVVLDASTEPGLLEHLEVVFGARAQTLRLEQFALGLELRQLRLEFVLDAPTGALQRRRTGGVVRRREEGELLHLAARLLGHRIEERDLLDHVLEERDANRLVAVGRLDLERVALHPEGAAIEHQLVAGVLHLHEAS